LGVALVLVGRERTSVGVGEDVHGRVVDAAQRVDLSARVITVPLRV